MAGTPASTLNSFQNFGDLFSFSVAITEFKDMWLSIWTWSLMSFGITHFVAGLVCALKVRKNTSWKAGVGIILLYTLFGLFIPVSAGSVTAALVALIHVYAGIDMPTTEALGFGVGQCVLYIVLGITNNLAFL